MCWGYSPCPFEAAMARVKGSSLDVIAELLNFCSPTDNVRIKEGSLAVKCIDAVPDTDNDASQSGQQQPKQVKRAEVLKELYCRCLAATRIFLEETLFHIKHPHFQAVRIMAIAQTLSACARGHPR